MQLIRDLTEYMVEIKAIEYADALRVAKETVARFPKAFELRTSNTPHGTEMNALYISIEWIH